MQIKVGVEIHAIEVDAARVSAVVSTLNAVGVQHRDQFENILSPELTGTRVVLAQDEVEESVEDETGRRLTGVDATRHHVHLKRENNVQLTTEAVRDQVTSRSAFKSLNQFHLDRNLSIISQFMFL